MLRGILILYSLVISGYHLCAKTISTQKEYLESISKDSTKKLVNLKNIIPGICIEMPYATKANFTKTVLYKNPICCMRYAPAFALHKVQLELYKKGLGLKIFDAYRPYSVTCTMWKLTPDKHYVANPAKGSNHNRAIAVDLSIIDLKTGKEIDMGTTFDNFTDTAGYDFNFADAKIHENRKTLREIMIKNGFSPIANEWWHFSWRDKERFEILDMDFETIALLLR